MTGYRISGRDRVRFLFGTPLFRLGKTGQKKDPDRREVSIIWFGDAAVKRRAADGASNATAANIEKRRRRICACPKG
jgi:hypothetical protein